MCKTPKKMSMQCMVQFSSCITTRFWEFGSDCARIRGSRIFSFLIRAKGLFTDEIAEPSVLDQIIETRGCFVWNELKWFLSSPVCWFHVSGHFSGYVQFRYIKWCFGFWPQSSLLSMVILNMLFHLRDCQHGQRKISSVLRCQNRNINCSVLTSASRSLLLSMGF